MDSDPATLTRKWLLRKERLANLDAKAMRQILLPEEAMEQAKLRSEVKQLQEQVHNLR
jgi:hypothetical protein